jgi:hypothetical protein
MRSGWQQGACPGRGAPWSRLGIVGHGLIWRREASRVLALSVGLPPTRVWRAYGRRDGAGCAWHKLHSTFRAKRRRPHRGALVQPEVGADNRAAGVGGCCVGSLRPGAAQP